MSKKRAYDATVSDDDVTPTAASTANQDETSDARHCILMELAFAAYNKMNLTGNISMIRPEKGTIFNVCAYSGSAIYHWVPDVPHSPGNTDYAQKWCFALGAFDPVTDWTTLEGVNAYVKSKYVQASCSPVDRTLISEFAAGEFVRYPVEWYARRAVYVVERWLQSMEKQGRFRKIEWADILSPEIWQDIHGTFLDEVDHAGASFSTDLPYRTSVRYEEKNGVQHSDNAYMYRLYPLTKNNGIARQTFKDSRCDFKVYALEVPDVVAEDGITKRAWPFKWKEEAFPDLFMTSHIALIYLMSMVTHGRCLEAMKEFVIQCDIDYHSPEIDELELIGDYLLALFESDYPSRFRDIPSLPGGISTVQDILYRPDAALGFFRPGEDGQGRGDYRRCEAERMYHIDSVAVLKDLKQTKPDQGAALEACMAESVELAATFILGSNPKTQAIQACPAHSCQASSSSSPSEEHDSTTTKEHDKANVDTIEQMSSRWSSHATHFKEYDEDGECGVYDSLDSNALIDLGKELMAGLEHYGWLRDIFLALLAEKVGTFAMLRWQRLNSHKRDNFSEAIDNLTVRLNRVKEILRYSEERTDLILEIDPADPKGTERRIRGLPAFVNGREPA